MENLFDNFFIDDDILQSDYTFRKVLRKIIRESYRKKPRCLGIFEINEISLKLNKHIELTPNRYKIMFNAASEFSQLLYDNRLYGKPI